MTARKVAEEVKNDKRVETVEIQGKEIELSLPISIDDIPFAALVEQEEGNQIGSIKELLGRDQFQKLIDAGMTVGDMNSKIQPILEDIMSTESPDGKK